MRITDPLLFVKSALTAIALLIGHSGIAGGQKPDLNSTIISFDLENASLKEAFYQIESHTRLSFSF